MVLGVSASIAGIRFFDKGFTGPHLAPSSVNAALAGDVPNEDSRAGTIIKPLEIPMAPVLSHAVVHATVGAGATVVSIAQLNGIPEASLLCPTLSPLSRTVPEPLPEPHLHIPPLP